MVIPKIKYHIINNFNKFDVNVSLLKLLKICRFEADVWSPDVKFGWRSPGWRKHNVKIQREGDVWSKSSVFYIREVPTNVKTKREDEPIVRSKRIVRDVDFTRCRKRSNWCDDLSWCPSWCSSSVPTEVKVISGFRSNL